MSQSFIRVRNKAEIDKLIDEVMKNKRTLTNAVTDYVVGNEFSQGEEAKKQAPVLAGLNKIVDKIDERLTVPVYENGKIKMNPDKTIARKTFMDMMMELINNNNTLTHDIKTHITKNTSRILFGLMESAALNHTNLTSLKKLSKKLGTTLTALLTATSGVAEITQLPLENVIDLLKSIKTEVARRIVESVGDTDNDDDEEIDRQFRGSAGQRDLGHDVSGGDTDDDDDDKPQSQGGHTTKKEKKKT